MVVPRKGKNIGARLLNSVGRVHVIDPRLWSRALGTDYWASFGETSIDADTGGAKLDDFGWTTTTLTETVATGAGDFLSSDTPGVPDHVLTDGSGDLLQSPAIFGGYAHGRAVESMLGYAPTQLTLECYASFTVVTGTSNRSGFGLVEDAGTAGTAADELAWIYTDGTNFTIRSDADSDAGAADDVDWHLWKITVKIGSATDAVEWFIDGTSQGTMDRKTDEWPVSFGMYAHTTNRPGLAWIHISYS
ncbi:hypothetical protein LCGC14_1078420 [marine sediment metagenome]|uniref:Uncharacterized protein n=1 Tax=marine sediment metagenome TaxID=412755 RepID=A0A0F9MG37_9ZZZZ